MSVLARAASAYLIRSYVAKVTPVVFPEPSSRMYITAIVLPSGESTFVSTCVTLPSFLFTISDTRSLMRRTAEWVCGP